MTVRSDTLVAAQHAAGTTTDYTVPANVTTILKGIRVSGKSTVAGTVDLQVQRPGGAKPTIVHLDLPAGGAVALAGLNALFIVLEPGDKIITVCAGTFVVVDVWCSGAELAGLAP